MFKKLFTMFRRKKTPPTPYEEVEKKILTSLYPSMKPADHFKALLQEKLLSHMKDASISSFWSRFWTRRFFAFATAFAVLVAAVFVGIFIFRGKDFILPEATLVKAGSQAVPVNFPVSVSFPYEIPVETLRQHFSITPGQEGELTLQDKVLTFTSGKFFRFGTEYTLKVFKEASPDMSEDFIFTFKTFDRSQKPFYISNYGALGHYFLSFYETDPQILMDLPEQGKYRMNVFKIDPGKLFDYLRNFEDFEKLDSIIPAFKKEAAENLEFTLQDANTSQYIYKPSFKDAGLYYVEIAPAQVAKGQLSVYRFFITYSRYAVSTKRLGDKLVSWALDTKTGTGVSNTKVTGYGEDFQKVLFSDRMDFRGLFQKTFENKDEQEYLPRAMIFDFQDEKVVALLRLNYGYNLFDVDWSNRRPEYKAYMMLDRPLYRPGDTVHFKSWIRKSDTLQFDRKYSTVRVEVTRDEYGSPMDTVFKEDFEVNDRGSIAGDFTLSKELRTGVYSFRLKFDDHEISKTRFNVEVFQKPDFEIDVNTDRDIYIAGDDLNISLSGRYFFGSPVKGQNVFLKIGGADASPSFTGSFDESGVFHQKISNFSPDQARDSMNSLWFQDGISIPVTATVREDTGKILTKTKLIQWYPSQYSVRISDPRHLWNLEPRKKTNFIFHVGRHQDQKQGVEGISVKVDLIKKDRVSVQDGAYRKYEEKETPVFENKILTTNFEGGASLEYEFGSGGSYEFRYSVTDSRGNVLNIREDFWIRDSEYGYYYDRLALADSKILIIPEKDFYKIGEKVRVKVFMMQDQGDAFLSLNTNLFKKVWTEKITANPQTFEFDVIDDLAPAFYFFVETYQGDSFVTGLQKISVTGKKLQITVTPSGKLAYPKEKIFLNVETKDENGNPVSSDGAITVIDKAILALKDDENKPFYDSFYEEPRSHFMSRFTNVDPLVVGFAEKGGCFLAGTKILMADGSLKNIEDIVSGDEILTKESDFSLRLVPDRVIRVFRHVVGEYYVINGTLRVTGVHRVFANDRWTTINQIQIGDFFRDTSGNRVPVRSIEKKINQVKVYNFETEKYHTYFADGVYVHNQKGDEESSPRKNFVDTAYWNAFVQTGDDGKGKVEFEVSDNLTTWVSLYKGMTGDTKLGEGRGEFVVSKSLLIRPVLPQFLRTSDEMTLVASVHNNSDQKISAKVLVKAAGVNILNETLQEISLNPYSNGNIYWKLKTLDDGDNAHFTFSVNEIGGKKVDVVEMSVPIYSSLNLDRITLTGNGEKDLLFGPDNGFDSLNFYRAVLAVTSSVTGILPEIIEKLTGYPYGCVEQTMSKHLPNVFAKKYSSLLGVKLPENIDQTLKDGLDRLKKFQHADGGFGWWEEDQTNIWMTGYVMEGLQMLKELDMLTGYESMHEQTLGYLLNTVQGLQGHEKIYIFYVLARTKNVKFKDENFYDQIMKIQERTAFTPQDYGYIALALHFQGNKKAASEVVEKFILPGLRDFHWEQIMDYMSMSDRYSATGVNLLALIEIGGASDDVIKNIVQWLMNHRQGYEGLWGSTRQSSQILIALIRYIQKFDEFDPDYYYKVSLNGKPFAGDDVSSPKYLKKFEISQRQLSKQNVLSFSQQGSGNLFYTLQIDNYVQDYELARKSAPDMSLSRIYRNAQGNAAKEFSFGEIVTVELHVKTPSDMNYLMVQDFLPAGFEPINDRLTRQQMASYPDYGTSFGPFFEEGFYDFGSDPIDIRDEKVVLFRQYGGPDQTFSYRVRAVKKGAFMAPSSKVESMYDPEKFASGDQMFVTIQ